MIAWLIILATDDPSEEEYLTELKTEDEALQVLLDADIDKVMAGLDRIVEAAPSYEKLFLRWERQHWTTEDFDFTEDARQWADPDLSPRRSASSCCSASRSSSSARSG